MTYKELKEKLENYGINDASEIGFSFDNTEQFWEFEIGDILKHEDYFEIELDY